MVDETISAEFEEEQSRYECACIEADAIPIHNFAGEVLSLLQDNKKLFFLFIFQSFPLVIGAIPRIV